MGWLKLPNLRLAILRKRVVGRRKLRLLTSQMKRFVVILNDEKDSLTLKCNIVDGGTHGRKIGGSLCRPEEIVLDHFPTLYHDLVRAFGEM